MKKRQFIPFTLIFSLLLLSGSLLSGQDQKVTTTSVCRFMSDPDNTRSVISYIPLGTELIVRGVKGDFWLVEYDGTEGYVDSGKVRDLSAEQDMQMDAPQNSAQTEEMEATIDFRSSEYQAARYQILIEKYGETTAKALFEHKIWKGIDHNMVRDSWGKPLEVKRTATSGEIREEWIYSKSRLVFVDDVLTWWGPVR